MGPSIKKITHDTKSGKLQKELHKIKMGLRRRAQNKDLQGLSKKSKVRMYVVDSGASLHVRGKEEFKVLSFAEGKENLEIQTASGIVRSTKVARVYIQELGTFLHLKLVESSPQVLSLGLVCDEFGYSNSCQLGDIPKVNARVRKPSRAGPAISSRRRHSAESHSIYKALPRQWKPCARQTEETILNVLAPFSESLIDNDAVLLRTSLPAEKKVGKTELRNNACFGCNRCGVRPRRQS